MQRKFRVWAVATALALAALLALTMALLGGRSRSAQRTVLERWAETVGTPDEVYERFPPHEINAAAREMAEITSLFGVESGPRAMEGLAKPDREVWKRYRSIRGPLGSWLNAQLSRTSGPVDRPPGEVVTYLAEIRQPLDRFRRALIDGESPLWPADMRRLFSAPAPNLLAYLDLNRLLLTDSLAALDAGDRDHAADSLEAAWQLGESLRDLANLQSQSIRLSMIRQQAAVVRQQPWLDIWLTRLDGSVYRDALEEALLYEGWVWPQVEWVVKEGDMFNKVASRIAAPYMTLASADASERWRQTILRLRALDFLCDRNLELQGVRIDVRLPWWNLPGKHMLHDFSSMIQAIAITELQLELTRKIVEAAAHRRRSGSWPEATESLLESNACPLDSWFYERSGSTVRLEFDRPLETSSAAVTWSFSLDSSTPAFAP